MTRPGPAQLRQSSRAEAAERAMPALQTAALDREQPESTLDGSAARHSTDQSNIQGTDDAFGPFFWAAGAGVLAGEA